MLVISNFLCIVGSEETDCVSLPLSWRVSSVSYEEGVVLVRWDSVKKLCADTLMISLAGEKEEFISHPLPVNKGEGSVHMRNRCQPHSLRLASLPPDRSKLVYSPPIIIWLPSYVMQKTVLPNMMFISLPECNNIKVSACSSLHCVTNNGVTSINSTQFSLTNLTPCTSYSINIVMHNNSIWTEQVITPARPKVKV